MVWVKWAATSSAKAPSSRLSRSRQSSRHSRSGARAKSISPAVMWSCATSSNADGRSQVSPSSRCSRSPSSRRVFASSVSPRAARSIPRLMRVAATEA